MTRQHFKALAEALKEDQASLKVCAGIASVCRRFNSNFDYNKFMEACGH